MLTLEGRQQVGDEVDHGLEGIFVHMAAAEALRNGDNADGQRGPRRNAVLGFDPIGDGATPAVTAPVQVEPDELR